MSNRILKKLHHEPKHILCPLCSHKRVLHYSRNLSILNYIQIVLTSVVFLLLAFNLLGMKSFILVPFVWMSFYSVNKFLYRKEISCPHCGFDATWYKRDHTVAKKLVQEFWQNKDQIKPEPVQK